MTLYLNDMYRLLVEQFADRGFPISFCDTFEALSDGDGWRVEGASIPDEIHLSKGGGNYLVGTTIGSCLSSAMYSQRVV